MDPPYCMDCLHFRAVQGQSAVVFINALQDQFIATPAQELFDHLPPVCALHDRKLSDLRLGVRFYHDDPPVPDRRVHTVSVYF